MDRSSSSSNSTAVDKQHSTVRKKQTSVDQHQQVFVIRSNPSSSSSNQTVPTSPTKKMKTSHQSSRNELLPSTVTNNKKKTKPSKSKPDPKNLKPSTKSSSRSRSKPSSSSYSQSSSLVSIFNFLFRVLICYLLLAYFYFCPKDPTQNPFVCSNLAQLHWALEPHLAPHLQNFNQNFRIPLQRRTDQKLGPIYRDYVKPSWSFVSPTLRKIYELALVSFKRSGTVELIEKNYKTYLLPRIDRAKAFYQHDLRPVLDSYSDQARLSIGIIRRSKFMKATRICLIRLSDSTNRIIIIPLRTKVLPLAYENYVNHIRPRLIRGMNAFYQKVILADDPMRRTFKKIKLCYRSRLLRWIRRVREIYVTPHLNKISKKLVNNLQSIRKNNSTLKSITRNDRSEQKVPFSNAKVSKRSEDAKDSFSEQFSSASNPSDPEKSNGQGDGEEIFTDDHQRDIMKEDDKVLEGVIEDEEHSLKDDSKGDESQSTSFLENERSTLELTPETADDDHLKDRFEEGGENIVEEEEDQSYHSEQVDKSEEQIIAEGDTEPEALNFQGADYGEEYDEEDEENTEEEEDEYHQLPKDSAPDTGAELIEDVDDFIEEIKSAKSSESESSDEPKRVNRRTPEETVEDRKELERTSAEGFEKMIELESRQLEEFTIRINKKRNQQNMRRHREFVNNFERLKKIEDEAEKLLNKIEKWFIKNEIVELKTIEEKLEDVKLVVEKSREKFKVKLIDANLEEIDEFGRKEYLIENEILEECWDVVDSHAVGVQAILGGGLTWLDGVTYRDWQVYHDFRTRSKKFKSKLEDIMMGNRTEFKSKIKEYDFFSSIEGVRNQVMERYEEFVEELKRVEEKRVKRLLRMKEKREIEAEIEYKRRLEAGEDVRTAEDLKDMTEEEVRAVAADAIQSLLSKDHRSRQQVQEGSKIPVKTESFQNPSPTTVAESKRSKEKEEINKLADIARKMMIDQQQALKADNEQIKRNAPAKPNKKKPKSSSDRGNKGKGDKHSSDGKKGERVVDDGSGGSKKGRDEL